MEYFKTVNFKTKAEAVAFMERNKEKYSMFEKDTYYGYVVSYKKIGDKNVWKLKLIAII